MNYTLARKRLSDVRELIDDYERANRLRFGAASDRSLDSRHKELEDDVRGQIWLRLDTAVTGNRSDPHWTGGRLL